MAKINWKIVGKKFGWACAEIFLSGLMVYLTDRNIYILLVPILEAGRNAIKRYAEIEWL